MYSRLGLSVKKAAFTVEKNRNALQQFSAVRGKMLLPQTAEF